MILPAEALSLVLSHCRVQPVEKVGLAEALGRVLARPIRADRDLPPADRSTMDGYAVQAGDLARVPGELRLVGEVAAGSRSQPFVKSGTCARIFTGANVPRGADSVAVIESAQEVSPTLIRFDAKVRCGQNIIRRAESARKGQLLLDDSCRLGPQQIAVCAAVGADPVAVFRKPCAAILCTGRELVASSARAARHVQRDSNGPALRAALQATRLAECTTCRLVDDAPSLLRRNARAALKTCDVLILVGGVSVGKYDFVPRVLDEIGCRVVFHGVKMKPGKPTLFALGPEKQLVFGLPGNPLSALTAFHEFVAPALRKMSGLPPPFLPKIIVRLQNSVTPDRSGRVRFYPASSGLDPDSGTAAAVAIANEFSADVVAGGHCDGVLVLPDEKTYETGSLVEFHPWGAGEL